MNEPDNIAELIEYCRRNERVCPIPARWNELYQILPEARRAGNGWEPALPLILGGWHYSSDLEKMFRLDEHIRWAADHGGFEKVAEFLTTLDESEWHHMGE